MTTEEKFLAAVEIINSLPSNGPFQPSDDLMLKFYAYHKQATEGPCMDPKPSFWEVMSRNKWSAWKNLGPMLKEDAMTMYIEELSKVIETMSYNEKVSKFISLMGPFYEVVWPDENESQEVIQNKKDLKNDRKLDDVNIPTQRPLFEKFPCAKYVQNQTNGFDQKSPKSYEALQISESFSFGLDVSRKNKEPASENHSTLTFEKHSHSSLSSDTQTASPRMTKSDVIEIFRKKKIPKNLPISSPKELLLLTVVNLQHSLEDIIKHLEKLENMARIANTKNQKNKCENLTPTAWGLTFPGTAFVLLWPLAVHWCVHYI